jgi:hypothetical protein
MPHYEIPALLVDMRTLKNSALSTLLLSHIILDNLGKFIGSKVFISQKKTISIMTWIQKHEPCNSSFQKFHVLLPTCEYIFELLIFAADNKLVPVKLILS